MKRKHTYQPCGKVHEKGVGPCQMCLVCDGYEDNKLHKTKPPKEQK